MQRKYAGVQPGSAPAASEPLGDGLISTAQAADNLNNARDQNPRSKAARTNVKYRLPTAGAIKDMMTSKSIPEAKLKDSIATALTRMKKEKKKLSTTDTVPEIMAKLFPKPGVFNEAEFKTLTASGDRSKVYKNVDDAEAQLTPADQAKMLDVFGRAITLCARAIGDPTGLEQVFGKSNVGNAQIIYVKAMISMIAAMVDMDNALSTDYNGDDPEIGLGGWASHSSAHVHLTRKVAQVDDVDDSTITIVHEFAHMADDTVDDNGYYGSSGFEAMSETDKMQNAAHFEELPARYLGKSKYAGLTFKPGVAKGGGKVTFEDQVRRKASEHLRKAWDKAVDVHTWLRERRQAVDIADTADFTKYKARLLEVSRLEKLTIHHQKPVKTVNMNDVILAEGIARGTALIQRIARKESVPKAPDKGKTVEDHSDRLITDAINGYGALTGAPGTDKTLMDWLVKEYRKDF